MRERNAFKLLAALIISAGCLVCPAVALGQAWLDLQHNVSNDDQTNIIRRSDHYRIIWGKQPTSGIPITEEFIQSNLQNLEYIWKRYNNAAPYGLGFYSPSVLQPTSDGNHYRANLYINNTHGRNDEGFAFGWTDSGISEFSICAEGLAPQDDPSTVTGHEHGHGCIIAAGGINNYSGDWHEGSANWLSSWAMDWFDPNIALYNSWYPLAHGRDYYGNSLCMETFRDELGNDFCSTFFKTGGNDYIFNSMAKQVTGSPDGYNVVKNVLGKMAAKCVNFDFQRGEYAKGVGYDFRQRYVYPALEAGSTTWYRVPWEQAPSQGGFNVIPLSTPPNTIVTVNFKGVCDWQRGSDWRACLVAVSSNGDSRYSSIWNWGLNSIKVSGDETLYLTVSCTPLFMTHNFNRDIPWSIEKEPQAYEFQLTNANVAEPNNGSTTGLVQVANGGGYRSSTATVAGTAWVGPNARVLGNAQVLGNARLEDYAVVQDSAVVKENAVVSGHAFVGGAAQVYGSARIRDFAIVRDATQVFGNGRVLEHGMLVDHAVVQDNACTKGYAVWYGGLSETTGLPVGVLSGYAIADGDACDGSLLDHGTSTGWSWGPNQSFNDGLPDTGGIFCQYNFDNPSPVYAKDTYGMTWGYLVNRPTQPYTLDSYRNTVLSLDGSTQYVECPRCLNDIKETTITVWVKWNGGANDQRIFSFGDGANKYMYLTPCDTANGKVKFVITNNGPAAEQALVGTAAITANRWTHIAVTLNGSTGTLYVDGAAVATNISMSLNPDDLNSANTLAYTNCNYIGRGNSGNYFSGYIDDFREYSLPQADAVVQGIAAQFQDRNAGPSAGSAPNPGMLWYKFDEASGTTAVDSSGSGKNGTVTSPTWTAGKTNNCLQFNGTSSRVDVPALSTSVSAFTITTWMYVSSIKGGSGWDANAIAATDGWGAGAIVAEFIGTGGGNVAGKLQWAINNSFEVYSNTKFDPASGNQGKWIHLALVYDSVSHTASIYIDGKLDNSVGTGSQAATLSGLRLGCWNGNSRYYNGRLDDFRIYNKALNAMEIGFFVPGDTTPPSPATSTWLIAPTAASSNMITMSATAATDTNGVEYNFTCTSGGGHSSGWITSNQYTDGGLTANTAYTYTVQTRDGLGNTGTASAPASATTLAATTTPPTPSTATFAIAPRGVDTTSITMTATKGTSGTGLVEYQFKRKNGSGTTLYTSSWQASPTFIDKGLTSGSLYKYSVQMRDANGLTGTVSANSASTYVRDNNPPYLPGGANYPTTSPWRTRPLVKPNGTVHMTARTATDTSGVQYYYHCSSGGGPDSGWIDSSSWDTTALADGTYTYQVKVRDKSAQYNETAYTGDETFTVGPKNVYHPYQISQLAALSDDYLVSFSGTVTAVGTNYYTVTSGGSSIKVMPNTTNSATDSTLLNRTANVLGAMWTYTSLGRTVTYATVAKVPYTYTITASAGANGTISPSGTVSVNENSDQTFTITPNAGYTINDVVVDGVSQGPLAPYTFTNVTANHTISVTFQVDPYSDLLTWYKFDETTGTTAADSSGHAKSGTTNAGCSWVAGKYNNSLAFDGATGSISIPSLGSSVPSFTIAGWMNIHSIPGGTGWNAAALAATDNWSAGDAILEFIGDGGGNVAGKLQFSINGSFEMYSNTLFNTASGNQNKWVHFAVTYGSTAKIYINGVQDASVGTGTQAANLSLLKLGSWFGGARFLDGQLDQVMIYNRVLSATEIANMSANTVNLTASAGVGGTISPSGTVAVAFGANQTFTITPNTGYNIAQVTVDGVNKGAIASYTFNAVTVAHTISASFAAQTYTITALAGPNGSISPSGAVTVNSGSNKAFTVTPNAGYGISSLKIDGADITPVIGYTFSNVIANHTIAALFTKPYGMNCKSVINDNKVTGRLITTWGKVKSINGTTSFVINDGYGSITVMVNGATLPTGFDTTKTAIVIGTVTADKKVQAQIIRAVP